MFEKNSFENFTYQKFKELMFDEKASKDFLEQIELAIQEKEHKEKKKLKSELKKKQISPRTFNKKEKELERWVSEEKRELSNKKQKFVQT